MMENLKFLIVNNVEISEELTYFPSGLRLLEWPKYPFNFPTNYCPQQLVALEMRESCIRLEKIFKQEFQYENMKSIDLGWCKSIRKLPGLRTPNLETLILRGCGNLIEVDEATGFLYKLKEWSLYNCKELQILPSKLNLKSLKYLNLRGCERLEKFPHIQPEMECLEILELGNCGITEWPSSLRYLTSELTILNLCKCQNLGDLFDTTTTNAFSQYGFGFGFPSLVRLELTYLDFDRNMVDLNIWLKPDYFPVLGTLDLSYSNIVTIPESITKFTRLQLLLLENCKQLREIPRLPQSIEFMNAKNCSSLDPQSSRRLLDQCGEFLGILPRSNVLLLRDPLLFDDFESESESGSEYEYDDHDYHIILPGDETPMWFKSGHHHSVGNPISFWVGREIPKFGVFIAFQSTKARKNHGACYLNVFINGKEDEEIGTLRELDEQKSENLMFFCVSRGQLYESAPSGMNHVEVACQVGGYDEDGDYYETSCDDNTDFIKWMGVHVECICCCPRGSSRRAPIGRWWQRRNHRLITKRPIRKQISRFKFPKWRRFQTGWI